MLNAPDPFMMRYDVMRARAARDIYARQRSGALCYRNVYARLLLCYALRHARVMLHAARRALRAQSARYARREWSMRSESMFFFFFFFFFFFLHYFFHAAIRHFPPHFIRHYLHVIA